MRIVSVLAVLLAALTLIAPASAATQSGDVSVSSNVPATMTFTVTPSSISFNLNEYAVFKAANSPVNVALSGNVNANVFVKLVSASSIVYKNPYDANNPISTTDAMVSGGLTPGENRNIAIQGKAVAGTAPGTYNDILRFTAISV